MSKENWKQLQRFDSYAVGMIPNCDRPASPNSPDGIPVQEVLDYLEITQFIDEIKIKPFTGWFPESKSGYYNLPHTLNKVIDKSKKTDELNLYLEGKIALARKKNFYNHLKNKTNIVYNTIDYTIPIYMYEWLKQARGYIDKDKKLLYPFVAWNPKGGSRYENGIVIFEHEYFVKFQRSK